MHFYHGEVLETKSDCVSNEMKSLTKTSYESNEIRYLSKCICLLNNHPYVLCFGINRHSSVYHNSTVRDLTIGNNFQDPSRAIT
jgi:hypothetical protein